MLIFDFCFERCRFLAKQLLIYNCPITSWISWMNLKNNKCSACGFVIVQTFVTLYSACSCRQKPRTYFSALEHWLVQLSGCCADCSLFVISFLRCSVAQRLVCITSIKPTSLFIPMTRFLLCYCFFHIITSLTQLTKTNARRAEAGVEARLLAWPSSTKR